MNPEQEKWDRRYSGGEDNDAAPCQVLREFAHLLPPQGHALDLAAGRGANARLLAGHGLITEAWDLSSVAMAQLAALAHKEGLSLTTRSRDVVAHPPAPGSFDLIVVSRFLHRPLCPALAAALRPGGLLFYQTFIADRADPAIGPANPDYLLAPNELLRLFPTLQTVAYREEGTLGRLDQGLRNEAYLVARRPA
ncbi:MAG: class I SAM-dependent methyltransferase [Gammaproteobacteria bacterium]|nr:class I SAM-dependent methyltransferase [Gammaproteobacteria bacterium]